MQVNATDLAPPAPPPLPPGAAANVRVVAGNVAAVPVGELLQAVVTQVTARDATLNVNGQLLTVRPPTGLQTGGTLFVRLPNATNGTLEISGPPRAVRAEAPLPPSGSVQIKVVDVLATLPDGRVNVRIDGQEQVATPRERLTPGEPSLPGERLVPGRQVILEVIQTPRGPVLGSPADTARLPVQVATAILQAATDAPELARVLKPLQAELSALADPLAQVAKGLSPLPAKVREAAAQVQETVRGLVPDAAKPPNAEQLQKLVENGGLQFEGKLARLGAEARPGVEADAEPSAQQVTRELRGDLKGDLLRLLQVSRELGVAAQIPAARAALDGIEAQQATQTLAREAGTPYVFQVPFPDRDGWRTLHLSIDPESRSDDGESAEHRAGRFRMLMHVPLSDLGETWVDAGLAGDSFRAAIYLERPDVRARVLAALPELRTELAVDGFAEVLLTVRATTELPTKTRERSAAMSAGRPPGSASLIDVRA